VDGDDPEGCWMRRSISVRRFLIACFVILAMGACQKTSETATPADLTATTPEIQIVELPLEGEAAKSDAEYSGLAWYDDYLVLLPQYPSRFGNSLWVIPKSQILAFLDGETDSLSPQKLTFNDAGIKTGLRGFEGFEALAFDGNIAYLTIESDAGSKMACYVVRGQIVSDLSILNLDAATQQEISHPVEIDNMCDEAILVSDGQVLTFFEANGANINPQPVVHRFNLELTPQDTGTLLNIEYRLTDVTAPDSAGRFWAINYMYPGDAGKLDPAPDPVADQFGIGKSHTESEVVERLLEFEITSEGIQLADTAPIWLQLLPDEARNWEGLVRLDERGFLLVTDKFPETILAFVPYP
jgi:hypothetical protein